MATDRLGPTIRGMYRILRSVGLSAGLVLLALGLTTPTGAEHELLHDPAARLKIVLKSIHVNDDHDFFSSGDMDMQLMVTKCPRPTWDDLCASQPNTLHTFYDKSRRFSADTGQTVTLNLPIPDDDLSTYDPESSNIHPGFGSEATGLSVYSGESYSLMVRILERDTGNDYEFMGVVFFRLEEERGWLNGPHSVRSAGSDGVPDGNFVVALEISRMPLPNLVAHSIILEDVPGSTTKLVCSRILNAGLKDAGGFDIIVRIDGGTPPGGKQRINGLNSGETKIPCFETDRLPADRAHFISLSVDEAREVPEMDDGRQRLMLNVPAQAGPSGGSQPPPNQAQADLVVTALRVNGKAPTVGDACKEGKNDIAATIKNQGNAPAGSSVARLEVDDDDPVEQAVPTLAAGAEREVKFDDVRLKKGDRVLTVAADAKKSVAESNEDNNELKVTVKCKDDD